MFFYYIPFVNKNIIFKTLDIFKNIKSQYILIAFFFVCIYFFNFPSKYFGGGIFFHLSQFIFGNNYFLFATFFLSMFLFKAAKLLNFQNILLFICMILYNLQLTIYHKYFDPLLLFIFLFLIVNNEINNKKSFLRITKNYYLLYLIFLGMSFYKVYIL